jgi:predicted dehydrogenase
MHLPWIRECEYFRVVAYADLNERIAQERLDEYGGEYATNDSTAIIDDDNIDVVGIFTPTAFHKDLVIRAAERSKPFYCEKPLALTSSDCLQLQAAVHETNVKHIVGYWFRFHDPFIAIREAVPNPCLLIARSAWPVSQWAGWHRDTNSYEVLSTRDPRAHYGLFDHFGYIIDAANYLTGGHPVEVFARPVLESGPAGNLCAVLRYSTGALVSATYSELGHSGALGKWLFEVSNGETSATLINLTELTILTDGRKTVTTHPYSQGRDTQWTRFGRYLESDTPSPYDVWHASLPSVICEHLVQSCETGKPVKVEIDTRYKNAF